MRHGIGALIMVGLILWEISATAQDGEKQHPPHWYEATPVPVQGMAMSDGRVVVGFVVIDLYSQRTRAARWHPTKGFAWLVGECDECNSIAYALNRHNVTVGTWAEGADGGAFLWRPDTGLEGLLPLEGSTGCAAQGINT